LLAVATVTALAFVAIKAWDVVTLLNSGLHPADNLSLACWFVITGAHALHVAGGAVGNLWTLRSVARLPAAHVAERVHALRLYWGFVDVIWIAMLASFLL
jgi:cytochrome c oxidase subunit 3